MSEHESFEDRLRAMADQISRSVQRMSEVDLEEIAEKYGVDAERARSFADAAGQWLSDRASSAEPLFGQSPPRDPATRAPREPADFEPQVPEGAAGGPPGPHPLDLPTGPQGLALSALDSGRWIVRPGSNRLTDTGEGPPAPEAADLVSELRARDWISAEGALTLVGRHALARWCRTAEDPLRPPAGPEPDAPST